MHLVAFETLKPVDLRPGPIVQNATGVDEHVGDKSLDSVIISTIDNLDMPKCIGLVPFGRDDAGIEGNVWVEVVRLGDRDEVISNFFGGCEARFPVKFHIVLH